MYTTLGVVIILALDLIANLFLGDEEEDVMAVLVVFNAIIGLIATIIGMIMNNHWVIVGMILVLIAFIGGFEIKYYDIIKAFKKKEY